MSCLECGKHYYPWGLNDQKEKLRIEVFIPDDNKCFNCGSEAIDVDLEEQEELDLVEANYVENHKEVLSFYQSMGLLVDFNLVTGYDDYDKIKTKIQVNCKH